MKIWRCQVCSATRNHKIGVCPECNSYTAPDGGDIYREEVASMPKKVSPKSKFKMAESKVLPLSEINSFAGERISSNINELDRVLGGGLLLGSVIILTGSPGIGKSTLVGLIADKASIGGRVLYASGEETQQQIKNRTMRMGINKDSIFVVYENDLETILRKHVVEIAPNILIVDSISTLKSQEIESNAGSVSQVRHCAEVLRDFAKKTNTIVLIIAHQTKDGSIAGPQTLDHAGDVTLYLEPDAMGVFRILRSTKNRFGSTDEVGIFQMVNNGLVEVEDPSSVFIGEWMEDAIGSSLGVTVEGQRPFLIEIQALVTDAEAAPERRAIGIDAKRLRQIIDSVSRHAKMVRDISSSNVSASIIGNFSVAESAIDAAVALAIVGSYLDIPVPKSTIAIGEIGLTGQVRAVHNLEKRINEAAKLGFTQIFIPGTSKNIPIIEGVNLIKVWNVGDLIANVFNVFEEEGVNG